MLLPYSFKENFKKFLTNLRSKVIFKTILINSLKTKLKKKNNIMCYMKYVVTDCKRRYIAQTKHAHEIRLNEHRNNYTTLYHNMVTTH